MLRCIEDSHMLTIPAYIKDYNQKSTCNNNDNNNNNELYLLRVYIYYKLIWPVMSPKHIFHSALAFY